MTVVVETPSGKLLGRTIDGIAGGDRVRLPRHPVREAAGRPAPLRAPEPIAPWAGVRAGRRVRRQRAAGRRW